MTGDKANEQRGNRRVCDRLDLNRRILLELDNGDILIGTTLDISLRGALVKTELPPDAGLLGVSAKLVMIDEHGQHSSGYDCRVVRLDPQAIALELDKRAVTAFGQHMTNDLFKRR